MNRQEPIVRGATRVTGILGWPVSHSLSPVMHNAAYRALGLDFVYVPFAVRPDDLAAAVAGLRALRVAGVNVTIPHKVAIAGLLDSLAREAALAGAVNTVVRLADGRLEGHNTDGAGFLASLREGLSLEPDGLRVLLLGSGGAARAVAVSLALGGALSVAVTNRTAGRAEALCTELSARMGGAVFRPVPFTADAMRKTFPNVDLLVNCTAVGMRGDAFDLDIPLDALAPHAAVADIVYAGGVTPLLMQAAAAGRRYLGGIGMLVHQGALAQQLWTGVRPPAHLMAEALRAELARAEG